MVRICSMGLLYTAGLLRSLTSLLAHNNKDAICSPSRIDFASKLVILIVMSLTYRPFIPGSGTPAALPLARFLPPLPAGIFSGWLKQSASPGAWLIDPIASTPHLALEAAQAGWRVLAVCNNPILSFMLEVLASAPSSSDLQAAVAELAASRRGEERLQAHLQSLYLTDCPGCGKRIQASAYIWKKDEPAPHLRELTCPHCRAAGEYPITAFDLERVQPPGNLNLLRARALERVSGSADAVHDSALEAFQSYLPRPLYFITTLINKIEGLPVSPDRQRLLMALALSACDKANTLWGHPSGRTRPRQLSTPPEFREENLWLAFEKAAAEWCSLPAQSVLTRYPQLPPPSGGICLFTGRLKNLLPFSAELSPQVAVAVLPRPNQAFWTLSAVWSGWLWGREAVQPLAVALERRRYDWQWHTSALHHIFSLLSKHTPPGFSFFGILPELVPGFLAAAVIAGQAAGFELDQAAQSVDPDMAQIQWKNAPARTIPPSTAAPQRIIQKAVSAHLAQRGEPSPYMPLYTAGMFSLAENGVLPAQQAQISFDTLTRVQNIVSAAFSDPTHITRFEASLKSIESGSWWIAEPPADLPLPLADRVEMAVVRYLLAHEETLQSELEEHLCESFPGLLTPPNDLVAECLASYADQTRQQSSRWRIRPAEQPSIRREDLRAVQVALVQLGKKLGYVSHGESPQTWNSPAGETLYHFYPLASAIVSPVLLNPQAVAAQSILVMPGSRSRLITFKLRRDSRLAAASAQGWRFLKFRLLREMLLRPDLDRAQFIDMLTGDAPTWEESSQMRFF